jgi:hypothetical protein
MVLLRGVTVDASELEAIWDRFFTGSGKICRDCQKFRVIGDNGSGGFPSCHDAKNL